MRIGVQTQYNRPTFCFICCKSTTIGGGGKVLALGALPPLPLAGCGPGMRRDMMTSNELQQVGSVKEKQDRSEDRALWHSKKNCQWRRAGCRRVNLLLPVAEIRRKPVNDLPAQTV